MRILRAAGEPEVVAAFLRAEVDSDRYGETLRAMLVRDGVAADVLRQPDTGDDRQNAYRTALLDEHRGWSRREGLLAGFPEHVDWFRAALTPAEVVSVLYIDWDWWLTISGGSRRPLDAAARIRRGEIDGVSAEDHRPVAAALRSSTPAPELIVAGPPDHERLVLVEGHYRLTAYALFPEYLPDELEVFLGTSAEIERWSEF